MYTPVRELVTRIKHQNPLIINITNHVTMDFVANGLLSLGASPIMTQSTHEIDDLLMIASGVVINIGTLDDAFIELCNAVCHAANRLEKPITFDPVGAGASQYRTKTCRNLLEQFEFSIIRGNASEIMALAGTHQNTKGVDANTATACAVDSGRYLASHFNLTVAISGKTDAVIDAHRAELFERGSPLMPKITGSGCLLSAVVSAFDAVHDNPYEAVSAAVNFYAVCGELAAEQANGPGTFKPHFLDALSCMHERNHYETN